MERRRLTVLEWCAQAEACATECGWHVPSVGQASACTSVCHGVMERRRLTVLEWCAQAEACATECGWHVPSVGQASACPSVCHGPDVGELLRGRRQQRRHFHVHGGSVRAQGTRPCGRPIATSCTPPSPPRSAWPAGSSTRC